MMQQQGFVVCDVLGSQESLDIAIISALLRTAIFVNGYASNTFASCLDP